MSGAVSEIFTKTEIQSTVKTGSVCAGDESIWEEGDSG